MVPGEEVYRVGLQRLGDLAERLHLEIGRAHYLRPSFGWGILRGLWVLTEGSTLKKKTASRPASLWLGALLVSLWLTTPALADEGSPAGEYGAGGCVPQQVYIPEANGCVAGEGHLPGQDMGELSVYSPEGEYLGQLKDFRDDPYVLEATEGPPREPNETTDPVAGEAIEETLAHSTAVEETTDVPGTGRAEPSGLAENERSTPDELPSTGGMLVLLIASGLLVAGVLLRRLA